MQKHICWSLDLLTNLSCMLFTMKINNTHAMWSLLEKISTQNRPPKKNNKIIFINFGGRKKTTFFVCIFDISPCEFTQISIERAHWMQNLIPHPTSYPDQNLSKKTGRYVENTNKKISFFFSSSKINKYYFIILTIILLIHFRRPILS